MSRLHVVVYVKYYKLYGNRVCPAGMSNTLPLGHFFCDPQIAINYNEQLIEKKCFTISLLCDNYVTDY